MKKETINMTRLGTFVLTGTVFLILGLYYIGRNKNIFSPSITVSANFKHVGGLVQGNNVRFNGINVGTVKDIYPVSDTAIKVEFTINRKSTRFISSSAIVSIGTDGLLGNKLINIVPGKTGDAQVQDGDELKARDPLDVDNAMRTLLLTNDNLKTITDNLKNISETLEDNNLVKLLSDTALSKDIRHAVIRFQATSQNTAIITGDLRDIVSSVKSGKGSIGTLLTDTSLQYGIRQTVINIESITDSIAYISGNFKALSTSLKNSRGIFGALLTDTMFVHNLNSSITNIKNGSGNFNDNMEALKHTWPLRKYFRKQKKSNSEKPH